MGWFSRLRTLLQLKSLLRNKGIKQIWVAKELDISPAYLSLIFNGKRRLTSRWEEDFKLLINHLKGERR
tara:strand:- start:147 stop:353 length:207 start_codon:yes stop_codon:yes gene_type:complete